MIPTKKMVQLRVDMVSAQYAYYKLQQNKKRTNPQIHDSDFHFLSWPFFVVKFIFWGGSKALQNPALPPLPVYSKRCLRHVPIKVVRNFAAPGKQCLSKQIVGLAEAAEAVYLRGIHIHIHMHMHIHVHIHIYLYLYLSVYIDLYISIHVIIPSSEPRFRLFSLQHFFIRRFCRGKRKAGKHTHGIRAGADWLLGTDTRRTHMMLEGLVNNTNNCNQTRT